MKNDSVYGQLIRAADGSYLWELLDMVRRIPPLRNWRPTMSWSLPVELVFQDIEAPDGEWLVPMNGYTVTRDGFRTLYVEGDNASGLIRMTIVERRSAFWLSGLNVRTGSEQTRSRPRSRQYVMTGRVLPRRPTGHR